MSIFDELLKPKTSQPAAQPSNSEAQPDAAVDDHASEGVFAESDAGTDSGPAPFTSPGSTEFQFESTGNPEVDAILQQKQADVARLLADARKASQAQPKPNREEEPKPDGADEQGKQKPIELPRNLYENHFRTQGSFPDDNAQNLAKTVPDVALHAVDAVYRPIIKEFQDTIAQLRTEMAELSGVKSEWSNQQWRGVRSAFGSAADAYKDEAFALSRSKGISLHAALVELNPKFVSSQQGARQQQQNLDNPRALRSAIPANGRSLNGGQSRQNESSQDDLEGQLSYLKKQIFSENAQRRKGR